MSIWCMNWVLQKSETELSDRLVLLAIADEADDDGTNAHPATRTIARKARVSRDTVMRSIVRLEHPALKKDGSPELDADGSIHRPPELLVRRPEKQGPGYFSRYVLLMGRDPHEVAAEIGWQQFVAVVRPVSTDSSDTGSPDQAGSRLLPASEVTEERGSNTESDEAGSSVLPIYQQLVRAGSTAVLPDPLTHSRDLINLSVNTYASDADRVRPERDDFDEPTPPSELLQEHPLDDRIVELASRSAKFIDRVSTNDDDCSSRHPASGSKR